MAVLPLAGEVTLREFSAEAEQELARLIGRYPERRAAL